MGKMDITSNNIVNIIYKTIFLLVVELIVGFTFLLYIHVRPQPELFNLMAMLMIIVIVIITVIAFLYMIKKAKQLAKDTEIDDLEEEKEV